MNEAMMELFFELVFSVLTAILLKHVIPFIRDTALYRKVKTGVQAAEKLKDAGQDIDKHDYVIAFLKAAGVKITPMVETMIESAVEELDQLRAKIKASLISRSGEE